MRLNTSYFTLAQRERDGMSSAASISSCDLDDDTSSPIRTVASPSGAEDVEAAEENELAQDDLILAHLGLRFVTRLNRCEPLTSLQETSKMARAAVKEFFTLRTCYDVMPLTNRVIVIDGTINLCAVARTMEEFGIQCAPIWYPRHQCLHGVVYMSDLAEIYSHNIAYCGTSLELFRTRSVLSWKRELEQGKSLVALSLADARQRRNTRVNTDFVTTSPSSTLFDSIHYMVQKKVSCACMIESQTQTCLSMLTLEFVLDYLVRRFRDDRKLFDNSIMALGVGTFSNIMSASVDDPLGDVLAMCVAHGLAEIPLFASHDSHVLVDVFKMKWVNHFIAKQVVAPGPREPIARALENLRENHLFPLPVTCSKSQASLRHVITLLVKSKANTVYVVNHDDELCGLCTVMDVFSYFCNDDDGSSMMGEN